jgi:hypothetical protein
MKAALLFIERAREVDEDSVRTIELLRISTTTHPVMKDSRIDNGKRGGRQGNASGGKASRLLHSMWGGVSANGKPGGDRATSQREDEENGDVRAESVINVNLLIVGLAMIKDGLETVHCDQFRPAAKVSGNGRDQ